MVNDILLKDVNKQIAETTDANELARLESKKAEYMSNITNDRGIVTGDYVDVLFKNILILLRTLHLVELVILKLIQLLKMTMFLIQVMVVVMVVVILILLIIMMMIM